MSSKKPNTNKTRLIGASVTTVISITLVLFVLGILGLLVGYTHKMSKQIRENIGITIFFNDDVKEADILKFQKDLDFSVYTQSTSYITKEQAAKELQAEIGEDFVSFTGFNPLKSSIEVHFKSNYANNDSILKIKNQIVKNAHVYEVYYQEDLVDKINKNVKTVSLFIIGFSIILFFISIALINNTIRLSVYSKRFVIRTMELVGATHAFIRRPFILKGVLYGIFASIIAIALLCGILYAGQNELPEIFTMQDIDMYAIIFLGIVLIGIVFSWVSTWVSVRKYLKMDKDKLYY